MTNALKAVGKVIIRACLVMSGVVVSVFVLLALIPGDVSSALLGSRATEENVSAIREQFGLDQPLLQRFWGYLSDIVHGGGTSFVTGAPVGEMIAARIAPTAIVVGLAFMIAVTLSLILALLAAQNPDGWADHLVRAITTISIGIPSFLLGMVLILVFGVWLAWLPVGGTSHGFSSFLLPALTAAVAIVPVVTRSLRVELLRVNRSDVVAAAKAAGLPMRIISLRYALPNAILPALTLMGVNVAYLIGGTFVIERVFGIDGLGSLMFTAIQDRDVPVIQMVVLYTALGVVIVNVVTGIVASTLDPRRRRGSQKVTS